MNTVNLTINGKAAHGTCEPRTHLADFVRDIHNLTGTHLGCEHGVCGACTLLVDGVPTRSCITFAAACEGADVTTVEGLDHDEITAELRVAFQQEHGLQCGYCTPGMIVSARDVVLRMQDPTEHEIRFVMSGNLCRCTGYVGITRAIQRVISDRRARGIDAVPGGNRDRLGPAGSGHAQGASETRTGASVPTKVTTAGQKSASTPAVSKDDGWKPQTSFLQSFTVSHPVDDVWEFFGRVGDVAGCLPGASLAGEPVDGHVEGQIKVKVGPISAEFLGVADITRDDATRTGTINGTGKDKRSNSATRGQIAYAVKQGDNQGETRVDVTIGFTLTGVLAQFSRSGLVQDVANRLISVFVQNLEARLRHQGTGEEGTAPVIATEFDAGSLMYTVVLGQVKQFFGWIFSRKPRS